MSTSTRPLVVIPGDDPVQISDSPQLDRLREAADLRLFRDCPADVEEQLRRVEEAEIVINSRGHVQWPADVLGRLPRLRMMTTCSIGTDAIDLAAASRLGVTVSNIPGRTAPVVAEHALALMLGAARQLASATAAVRAGQWSVPENTYLRGKTLGVIGTGSIGAEVIRLGRAIGMQVIAWTFHPSAQRARQLDVEYLELEPLLRRSDVVSLHVKLTPESRHLIGRRQLSWMKRGALLVNTARGAVVDKTALVEALQSGHLGGAALDVFDTEPLPPDDPILSCQQLVLTPHTADQNPEGRDILNGGAVDNVLAYLAGHPQNVVTVTM